ncbi:MAG: iron-containing alcohol dehydrogenase [Lentisphaerota bacterium]
MFNFEFSQLQKIVFGAGKINEAGNLGKAFGKRAVLVCDPFCRKSGTADKVVNSLKAAGISCAVYDEVIPNPTCDSIDKAAALARETDSEFVIGLGGGSSMDTAKGTAVAATHSGGVWDYAIGNKPVSDNVLPVIAISTTSGTGSQCTMFSVITNPRTRQKPGMGSPYILPKVAIIDPELMLTLPQGQTLVTGFDVFCHAVEAYTSNASSPVSDIYAEKAIELTARYLPVVYREGNNLETRSMMALADTFAGVAINNAVVSLAHVLAHVIGGHCEDVAHGDALYAIYREVLKFNSWALPEKHRFIARQLEPGSDDVVSAFDSFYKQFSFVNKFKEKCRLEPKLIDIVANDTFTYMSGIVELNPVKADVDAVRQIIRKSVE